MEQVEKEVMTHLENLCLKIGSRLIGSSGNQVAAEYIKKIFQTNGLNIKLQQISCPNWTHEQTRLVLGGKILNAVANAFSPSCDVFAATTAFGTISELEAADLTGRIGIMYGGLATSPLPAKKWLFHSELDKKIIQLLEEKQPAALITINPKIGNSERLIEDYEMAIPSITVTPETGLTLLRNIGSKVQLKIDTHRTEGNTYNITGKKTRTRKGRILICAHYDTKIDTPGAFDNASGVAVLLTLVRLLTQQKLITDLEFVAFTAEEYQVPEVRGSVDYVKQYEDLDNLMFVINMDGVGQLTGVNNISINESSQQLEEELLSLTKKYPDLQWVPPWPESDHSAFSWRGVPSIVISCTGVQDHHHRPYDTLDWISPRRLTQAIMLVKDIVLMFQDKPVSWFRKQKQ